jgi:SH3 domain protein
MRSLLLPLTLLPTLLLLGASTAQAQTTRYITDSLRLEARSAPGPRNRIVRMLSSGTPVQVLNRRDGWSEVRLEGGTRAWVLDRYLMSEPPARGQVETARKKLEAAEARAAELEQRVAELKKDNTALQESRDAFVAQAESVAQELGDIKRTAASTIQIRNENRQLKDEVNSLSSQMDILQRDYTVLQDARSRDWFLAGAGVLLGGMVLGLIIPKIRWKRRRGWGEL